METPAPTNLDALADGIFEALARRFPVCSASDEFHFFPQAVAASPDWGRWDDFSPEAVADAVERLARWERTVEALPASSADPAREIDADLLVRALRTLREQLQWAGVHHAQPTFHLTVAGIGLADAAAAGRRAFEARLAGLPAFLDRAGHALVRLPRRFLDMGLEMLARQRTWLGGLALPRTAGPPVAAALDRLEGRLRGAAVVEDFLPPPERYAHIAFHHIGCRLPPDDIARELDAEIEETRLLLERSAAALSPGRPWQEAVRELPRPPLPPGGVFQVYRETIDRLARHCETLGLIGPGFLRRCPVAVEAIADFMRPVRSNAAYAMAPGHPPRGGTFHLLADGPDAPVSTDYRLLAAHETLPGHHLLDTRRWGHPRPVRRHLEFPLFYEGWASFSEELLFDTGFFPEPADRMLMAKRRFWRAMRGRVDLDLHTRRKGPRDCAAFLAADGMEPGRAEAMVRRYALKPGYQLSYTMGRRRFRRLYTAFRAEGGTPAAFARGVLAQGEIHFHHLEQTLRQGG